MEHNVINIPFTIRRNPMIVRLTLSGIRSIISMNKSTLYAYLKQSTHMFITKNHKIFSPPPIITLLAVHD